MLEWVFWWVDRQAGAQLVCVCDGEVGRSSVRQMACWAGWEVRGRELWTRGQSDGQEPGYFLSVSTPAKGIPFPRHPPQGPGGILGHRLPLHLTNPRSSNCLHPRQLWLDLVPSPP